MVQSKMQICRVSMRFKLSQPPHHHLLHTNRDSQRWQLFGKVLYMQGALASGAIYCIKLGRTHVRQITCQSRSVQLIGTLTCDVQATKTTTTTSTRRVKKWAPLRLVGWLTYLHTIKINRRLNVCMCECVDRLEPIELKLNRWIANLFRQLHAWCGRFVGEVMKDFLLRIQIHICAV